MRRREVLRALGLAAAVPFVPGMARADEWRREIDEAIRQGRPFRTLGPPQQQLVSEIADRIIPRTDTPGALDVGVPLFIDLMLTDWYEPAETGRFLADLGGIDARAGDAGFTSFVAMPEEAKAGLMRRLDAARRDTEGAGAAFGRIKALTLYGYFTSERVVRDVLRTRSSFATFDGCVVPAS